MKTSQNLSKAFILSRAILAILAIAAVFTSCEPGTGASSTPVAPEFIDQPLQGHFNGKDFTFVSGYAEEDFWEPTDLLFQFYNIAPDGSADPWSLGAYPFLGYLKVMMSLPAAVGTYNLYFDANGFRTVTMYDPDDGSLNIIAIIGKVEIISLDTVAGTVTGRMAIAYDSENWVNGNFTLDIAPSD